MSQCNLVYSLPNFANNIFPSSVSNDSVSFYSAILLVETFLGLFVIITHAPHKPGISRSQYPRLINHLQSHLYHCVCGCVTSLYKYIRGIVSTTDGPSYMTEYLLGLTYWYMFIMGNQTVYNKVS